MKAFVYSEKGHIEKRELPDVHLSGADPADAYAAVLTPCFLSPCSSDVHTVYAGDGPRRDNLVLGHEGLARILEVGDQVRDFRPGELVAVAAVMPEVPFGHGHEGMHFSGTKLGRNIDGMWAERFKVPMADQNLAHIPAELTMEQALMAVDMMATGFTAAVKALIAPEESPSVTVIGSGAVGLMAAAGAKALGAGRIFMIGSDKNDITLQLARKYGVDTYLSYRDGKILCSAREPASGESASENTASQNTSPFQYTPDPRANASGSPAVDQLLRLTGGRGTDRVLICGGGHEVLMQACDILSYGNGVAVNVSYIEGSGEIGLPIFSLGRGMAGKSFVFTLSNGGRQWIEKMFDYIRKNQIDPGRLITHHLRGFDAIPEALKLMKQRPKELIKIMVEIELRNP